MTDLSNEFKAAIKSIRTSSNPDDLNYKLGLKSEKKSNPKNGFNVSSEAQNITNNIKKLRDFLMENKQFYVQPNYLVANKPSISYEDKINFENQVENSIQLCSESLKTLKNKAFYQKTSEQYKFHLDNLFVLLEAYLKDVCKLYSKQKAIQIQRTIETKNLSQLYTPKSNTTSETKTIIDDLDQQIEDKKTEGLSQEEIQMFEKENDLLFEKMSIASQEIKQIQSHVHDIAKLQQLFTEKILEQQPMIDQIYSTTTEVRDNIKRGNDELQDAMKKIGALRIAILFIIIVLSFTLMFLNWYND